MKNLKWYAILLTITLAVSGCCPANVIAASAAETISVEEENAGADTAVADEETTDSASEAETIDADDKETESEETSEGDTTESETAEETSEEESAAEDKKEDASGQEAISDEEEPADEESMIPEGGASSDEMFAAYVDNAFGISGKDSRMLKARRPSAGSRLIAYDRAVYDYISSQLPLIESGERTETIFTLKISDMGLEKSEWTFAELNALGVTAVVGEDGKLTAEAKQVIREQVNYDWDLVINALLADHPYLLYWYKKNASTYLTPYSLSKNTEQKRVWLSGNCIAKLPVQEEYASGQYEVDPSIGQTVRDSAAYAASIVEQHADEDDCQKLVSYRDEICRLTSYNFTDFSPTDYGDPWQLIWVFDQNLQTNVVCEGYSKAFQYLFNQSTFDNDLGCLLITGDVDFGHGPGGHMWNVVSMFNDRNYIVDVTNCDIGSVGSNRLFLIGGTGTPQDGYTVDCGYLYTYDQDALSVWNTEELTLSDHNFRYLPTLTVTGIVDKTYNGEAHMQDLDVMDGDEVLTEGEHYTVTYGNNTNATEDTPDAPATVTITGITENGYYGSATREFQIEKASNAITVETAGITERYSRSDRTYAIGAEALGGDIVYSSDHDGVQVSSDGEVTISAGFIGEAAITITAGDRNYKTATRSVPIAVRLISVEELDITGLSDQTYTGEELTQNLIVMDGDDVLTEGVHYTVEYGNNTNATEDTPEMPATVTITGIGENGYTGSRTEGFRIEKASNAITVGTAGITKVYSAGSRTYALNATALGGNLTYSSNNSGVQVSSAGKVTIKAGFIGKAVITITAGDSNYKTVTKKVPVVVNPTMTCILSLTSPKAGQMLVTYKKNTIGTGYQIQFSLNKEFSPASSAWVTSNTTLTRKIGNLQKGQKYYVRIRTYKLVDGVKFYSAWSTIKAIRISK